MLRLKATKKRLYNLVASFEALPPLTKTAFAKAYRSTDYWLRWYGGGLWCEAFLAVCAGRPLLAITKKDYDGPEVSRVVLSMDVEELREGVLGEEWAPAAERRAACAAV